MVIIKSESFFKNVELAPPNLTLNLIRAFKADESPFKVNLAVGAYRTDENQPFVLPAVRRAAAKLLDNVKINHEYISPGGEKSYTNSVVEFLLGKDSIAIKENRVHGFQTLSGTGALRMGAEFLINVLGCNTIYLSNPTWENHPRVMNQAGFPNIREYRYWSSETRSIDIDGMINDLENAPEGAAVLLHACAHNPTGCDPTTDQWIRIANTVEKKKLFVFFDSAYQGFASGDTVKDSFPVRYFVSRGLEMFCAQSFSKIFGLYSERVGNLTVVHKESSTIAAVKDQLTNIACDMYLNPPAYGARIVQTILNDDVLYEEWLKNLKEMSGRLISIRESLYNELSRLNTPGTWHHIIDQIGMFSYTGLSENQVKYIVEEHHIYFRKTGRISMGGLNNSNVAYVARAIHSAVTSIPN